MSSSTHNERVQAGACETGHGANEPSAHPTRRRITNGRTVLALRRLSLVFKLQELVTQLPLLRERMVSSLESKRATTIAWDRLFSKCLFCICAAAACTCVHGVRVRLTIAACMHDLFFGKLELGLQAIVEAGHFVQLCGRGSALAD